MGLVGPLDRIRAGIRRGRYEVTFHAWEEAEADRLTLLDLKHVLMTGRITRKYGKKGVARRYRMEGRSSDGRWVAVVVRFTERADIRVITAFEVK